MREFTSDFYLNEHLIYGHVGHLLIVTAFVCAIFTSILGLEAFLKPDRFHQRIHAIKTFFWLHTWSIIAILALLIFLFYGQYREYHYIWRHSSSELPWYYILSALWEGQEGSFLLWIFWHTILGVFLLRNLNENKLGALSILMLVQSLLMTMILGVDVFGKLIGTNPFILLRNEMNIPILSNPNYLEMIKDGNGLNILLQNYWMVIHPPVLFLGFASTCIPFAFAFSSLLKKEFTTWVRDTQSWALFSMAMLGLGILMGGRWAYEALSFGGFWAWDPVENASLVPWLFLVAGVHTLMIYRATQYSLKATYGFFILAFGFVLYSTFLTRSGILGDSSVHSFTDLGMTGQLLIFLAVLILPPFFLLAFYWSHIPQLKDEEKTWSREFWMFLGALFIVVSAIQISFSTSIPVWNKLYDLKLAPPLNANEHYNAIQIWFAIIVSTLMGVALWLDYQDTRDKSKKLKTLISLIVCIILGIGVAYIREISNLQQYTISFGEKSKFSFDFLSSYLLLLISTIFLIVESLRYFIREIKNPKILSHGGSIAHLGFGFLILGALISQFEKKPISTNKARIDFGKEMNMEEQSSNSLLMNGEKEEMGDYLVSYQGKESIKQGEKYKVFFENKNDKSKNFHLYPEAKIIREGANNRLNPEPSIEHLWDKDIFAHVSSVPQDNEEPKAESRPMKLNDTLYAKKGLIILDTILVKSDGSQGTIDLRAKLLFQKSGESDETLYIPYNLETKSGRVNNPIISSADLSLRINLISIQPDKQEFQFSILDLNKPSDWIIIKVLEFPHISILWIGCILMTIGSIMSAAYRKRIS